MSSRTRGRGPHRLVVVALLLLGCSGTSSDKGATSADAGAEATAPDDVGRSPLETRPEAPATDAEPIEDSCPPAIPHEGEVRARSLACEEDLPAGRQVAARVGDLVLENAVARFVVRAEGEGHAIMGLPRGGLIDAVRQPVGLGLGLDDGLRELMLSAELWLVEPLLVWAEADGAGGEARVVAEGPITSFQTFHDALPLPQPDIVGRHEYVLRPDSTVLEIHTTLRPKVPEATASTTIMDLLFWSGDLRQTVPGHAGGGDALPPDGSVEWLVAEPAGPEANVPAYALAASWSREILNAGPVVAFLHDTPFIEGEGATLIRWLAVGGPGDPRDPAGALAVVADAAGATLTAVHGTIDSAAVGDRVEVLDEEEIVLGRCLPDPEGAFSCALPGEVAAARVAHQPSGVVGPSVALPATGDLILPSPSYARLEVSAEDSEGTLLAFRLTARDEAGAIRHLVGGPDTTAFDLPAGHWELWVTAGPARAHHSAEVTLLAGEEESLATTLPEVVPAPGWIAADLHVHAEDSMDSQLPGRVRTLEAAAEGLRYVVSTDHDSVGPWDTEGLPAALLDQVLVVSGVEVTTMDSGHFNAWPIPAEPAASGQGAPKWWGLDADEILTAASAGDPHRIVQCNHPRVSKGYAAFFDVIELGPDSGPQDADHVACDTVELLNGFDLEGWHEVLEDWFLLLELGHRVTGVGVSDSHTLAERPGHVRTLVYVGEEAADRTDPASLTPQHVDDALRAGRAVATAGPFLDLAVVDAEGQRTPIGGLLSPAPAGLEGLTAHVELQAPEWMALGTLHLVLDGKEVYTADASGVPTVDGRRHLVVDVPLAKAGAAAGPGDHWIVAWHDGAPASWPGTLEEAVALTNPVLLDGDGDGAW